MRTIIAGGRDFFDESLLKYSIHKSLPWKITSVVSGGALGADKLGEGWAHEANISYTVYPANWQLHGKSAGPVRNRKMALNADALLAFWDGKSRGTSNMISTAEKAGLKVHVVRY